MQRNLKVVVGWVVVGFLGGFVFVFLGGGINMETY